MAAYLAQAFEEGRMNYNTIFSRNRYKKYKDDVDDILAADGYIINADGTVTKEVE